MRTPWKQIGIGYLILVAVALFWTSPIWLKMWHERSLAIGAFQSYATALSRGDYQTAYSYFAEEVKESVPIDSFVNQQKVLAARFGPLSAVSRQGVDIEGGGSPIVWVVHLQADHHYVKRAVRFGYVWHRENGRWVLWSYDQLN